MFGELGMHRLDLADGVLDAFGHGATGTFGSGSRWTIAAADAHRAGQLLAEHFDLRTRPMDRSQIIEALVLLQFAAELAQPLPIFFLCACIQRGESLRPSR